MGVRRIPALQIDKVHQDLNYQAKAWSRVNCVNNMPWKPSASHPWNGIAACG
jgi:hypothetical protein